MNDVATRTAREYAAALFEYLGGAGESALARAYELGRRALAEGLGVLDLAPIHDEALIALGVRGEEAADWRLERAAEFFREALSPFEMAFRGYEDANAGLRALNAALNEQNESLKAAKLAADVANRDLEAFAYSVSHDLRAPLRAVAGYARMLVEDHSAGLDAEGIRKLGVVSDGVVRMGRLIDDLLEFSRTGKAALSVRPVDMRALADEAVRATGTDASKVRVRVGPLPPARGDPALLRQVLANLVGNAFKYSGGVPAPEVEIGGRAGDGENTYWVRDNGVGFDPKYAHKLFGVFQRLHSADEFPGTGIGLALAKRIIERHGGRIRAEGGVGRGATITFTLPGAGEGDG